MGQRPPAAPWDMMDPTRNADATAVGPILAGAGSVVPLLAAGGMCRWRCDYPWHIPALPPLPVPGLF